jgi:hypothetical protein|tara:strand:+ start:2299 stop:2736 length:438 start_codon:yes stop_codon:yes gene_type:complete
MAFVNKEDVKAIRQELKKQYPNIKFSVRKDHHSSVQVALVSGDVDFYDGSLDFFDRYSQKITPFPGSAQINHYHTHFYGIHKALFDSIYEICKTAPINGNGYHKGTGWFDKSDCQTDYFHTAYYINIAVGAWNKNYETTNQKVAA